MKLGARFVHQCSVGVARLRGCLRMEWNFPIRAGHREAAGRAQEVRLVVLKWFTVVSRWAELMNCGGAQGDGLRIVELAQRREKGRAGWYLWTGSSPDGPEAGQTGPRSRVRTGA